MSYIAPPSHRSRHATFLVVPGRKVGENERGDEFVAYRFLGTRLATLPYGRVSARTIDKRRETYGCDIIRLMRSFVREFAIYAMYIALCACTAAAQGSEADLRAYLAKYAAIDAKELADLDAGNILVKALRGSDKQEIVVLGIVRVKDLPIVGLKEFRDSLSQRKNTEMDAKGRFGSPPEVADLAALKLEDRDFQELQKCIVADCDVNMSAEWIGKFGGGFDWAAADHREKAAEQFRQMLLEYAANYSSGGTASLGEYANRAKPVSLPASHRTLLENSLFLAEFVPELDSYLSEFPKKELPGVESEITWSNLDFGLNPTVTMTHAAAFTNAAGNHFVAARQFYSSRYLDASLSLTMMLRFPDGVAYIVFTDRSRSDALEGIFRGVSKRVVEAEAIERVKGLLKNSELRLIADAKRRSAPEPVQSEPTFVERLTDWLKSPLGIALAAVILGSIGLLILKRVRG